MVCSQPCVQFILFIKGLEIGWPFFKIRNILKLLLACPLKLHSKFVRANWICSAKCLKMVRKWPMANCYLSSVGGNQCWQEWECVKSPDASQETLHEAMCRADRNTEEMLTK